MAFDIHIINPANTALLDVVAPDVFDTPIQPQLLQFSAPNPTIFWLLLRSTISLWGKYAPCCIIIPTNRPSFILIIWV